MVESASLSHPAKYRCIHVGYTNLGYDCFLGDDRIQIVTQEKDLGVIVQNDMSPGAHIEEIVKNVNRNLGTIRRAYTFKSQHNIIIMVRPLLDYASTVWLPHLIKDNVKLEKVQQRATRMIGNIRKLPCEQRLRRCKLMSLESRRKKYDLLETFKIMKAVTDIDYRKLFVLHNGPSGRGPTMDPAVEDTQWTQR